MLDKALAVAAAKAKVAGLVIAAAALGATAATAGGMSFNPVSGETASPEASASPDVSASPEVSPSPDTSASPDVSPFPEVSPSPEASPEVTPTDVTPVVCPEGLKNHGEYVSSVARDKTLKGAAHGKAVSEAAKSDCGKKAGTEADADAAEVETDEPREKKAKKAKKAKRS